MNKLIITIVQNDDADSVVDALLESDFRATRLASTGGFLRRGNTTLMIGAQTDQVDTVLDLIRKNARTGIAREDEAPGSDPTGGGNRVRARSRGIRALLAVQTRSVADLRFHRSAHDPSHLTLDVDSEIGGRPDGRSPD